MVTEKNSGSTHDFLKDPIRLLVEGDWLTADGTTLGADNGIGVAAALTLLDCKLRAAYSHAVEESRKLMNENTEACRGSFSGSRGAICCPLTGSLEYKRWRTY